MNKKNYAQIALILVLAVIYVIYFTDWFRAKTMVISHTTRPLGYQGREILLFSLGHEYNVTEIKVVPLAEWQTNKLAQPLWHLVGKSTDPINHFNYGRKIDGLDPEVDGSRAIPPQPGILYRIFVSAGSTKGSHDFQIGPVAGSSPPLAVRPGP